MVRLVLAAALLLVACKERAAPVVESPALVAPGTLRRVPVESTYFVAAGPGADLAALEQRARVAGIAVRRVALADVVDAEALDAMAPEDAAVLRSAPGFFALTGAGSDPMALDRTLAGLAHDLAAASQGWVLDRERGIMFSAADFHERWSDERPHALQLVGVYSTEGNNKLPSLTTTGMQRFGLTGVLETRPGRLDSLRQGQTVTVKLADIGDYLHMPPDGPVAGNYSRALLKARGLIPADED